MNVVLCNIDPSLTSIIISQLVHFKLNIIPVEEEKDLLPVLQQKKIDCLFYDIDIFETDVIAILKEIKSRPELVKLKIVVLTANKDKNLLHELFTLQLSGVLSKNMNYHDFIRNLKKIIVFLEMEVNIRENKWVAPPAEDNAKILLPVNRQQNLNLKVAGISVDGIKVKISDEMSSMFPKEGTICKNVIFYINRKILYINMKADTVAGGIATLYFTDKKDVVLLEISSYIYHLVASNNYQ